MGSLLWGRRVLLGRCVHRRLVLHDAAASRNLRVTPAQDTIVRRVLSATGMSLNEYVVSPTVAAATSDLADRQIFVLKPDAWDEFQELLNRPPAPNPRTTALLGQPSTLEDE